MAGPLGLGALAASGLYRRRRHRLRPPPAAPGNMSNALANAVCQRCQARFAPAERIVNSNGELYHEHCFVCAQCFRPFPEGLFYEFEGRKYCEHDFQMLFAPCCGSCGEFIIGRVIKAMNNNWHPGCFRCELCDVELADLGFVKNAGRHLCRPCHNREKAKGLGKYVCQRCHLVIDEQPLMFKNDAYHPDHFSCTHCGKELTAEARELKGELYCLPCHDKMGVPICGACRRPIEGRVVNALGKQWHVEEQVCGVRHEARVQEMLREVSIGAEEAAEEAVGAGCPQGPPQVCGPQLRLRDLLPALCLHGPLPASDPAPGAPSHCCLHSASLLPVCGLPFLPSFLPSSSPLISSPSLPPPSTGSSPLPSPPHSLCSLTPLLPLIPHLCLLPRPFFSPLLWAPLFPSTKA
ncbi:LIM and senescent cell antigen-like-containing domain protein 2 isoform X3 [Canis lupus baileyi]|uniref:LIM and senescent cell antigen-like-containing domain protein 2 isoform X3 n=1 Tax=Canis lupus dingo TaxID=286419 RepID=UPI0020C1DEB0|nr:LIM and senescent cell antigen-like-containing domain protein 2 isoform X3 [Canis lupus dingo]